MRIKSTHVDEINNVEKSGHVNETFLHKESTTLMKLHSWTKIRTWIEFTMQMQLTISIKCIKWMDKFNQNGWKWTWFMNLQWLKMTEIDMDEQNDIDEIDHMDVVTIWIRFTYIDDMTISKLDAFHPTIFGWSISFMNIISSVCYDFLAYA